MIRDWIKAKYHKMLRHSFFKKIKNIWNKVFSND